MKLLIAGFLGGTHLGTAFLKAAQSLNTEANFIDTQLAYAAPKLLQKINWHLRGRYPTKLENFSQEVLQTCLKKKPEVLLATGIAPIDKKTLLQIGSMGIKRINFLTDDPWNPVHYAPWFFPSLPFYDIVFSPRRSNIDDLLKAGCLNVQYLPFGFDSELFYPELSITALEKNQYTCDVLFAGGGDKDRANSIAALIHTGINVHLYGGYWERFLETKAFTHGMADIPTLRRAIKCAKVVLCLVRRANRDGNCMRTFEVPAVGACMLTEDTQEHREIFGDEGKAVVYFKTIPEMVEKTRWLLAHDTERQRLAQNAHQLITQGKHTYKDRLESMLSVAGFLHLQS